MPMTGTSGLGLGRDLGKEACVRGDCVVGALLMTSVMRVLTLVGWTFSTRVNAGRRRTVVGSE